MSVFLIMNSNISFINKQLCTFPRLLAFTARPFRQRMSLFIQSDRMADDVDVQSLSVVPKHLKKKKKDH